MGNSANKKEKLKNKKGITLIALVVTIVVLLILAGITINLILGDNGIFGKAQQAERDWKQAEQKEQEDLNALGEKVNEILENKTNEEDKTSLKFLVNSEDDGIVGLPISEYAEVEIDWGDGTTTEPNVAKEKSIKIASLNNIKLASKPFDCFTPHEYSIKNKEYTVTVKGEITEINTKFGNCTKGKIIEVKQWQKSGLEKVRLSDCTNLRKIASPTKDTFKNVKNFGWIFDGCTSLTSIPENLFANCPNVTSFMKTFAGCTGLTSIPENLFANCPNVSNFGETFEGCTGLTSIPENLFANCPNVTSFMRTFAGCTGLTSIPENLFANCPNVSSFGETFEGCTGLTSIPENLFANCPNVSEFTYTFRNCTSLTGNAIPLWERVENGVQNGYVGEPTGEDCYAGCTGLTNYSAIPEYWK